MRSGDMNNEYRKQRYEIVRGWLRQNVDRPGFKGFMEIIADQQECHISASLRPGDTNYEKGQAAALTWVVGQPETILTPVDDPSEPSTDKG